MTLREEFKKEIGTEEIWPGIDIFRTQYISWLEAKVEKLKMSAQPEAQRSHILVLDEVRELIKLCNDLGGLREFLIKEKFLEDGDLYDMIFEKLNKKAEIIKAHFV